MDDGLTKVRGIEERAFNAWPALASVQCDGWLFRFSRGLTKRANSVNALQPAGRFRDTLGLAEDLYPRQRLPVIFRLSPLAGDEPDDTLHRVGYRRIDETLVMTAALGDRRPADPEVVITCSPDTSWSEGFASANGISPTMREIHDRMLGSILLPAAFATVLDGGRAAGYGLAVAERGMVGLFDIVTVPEFRRRGIARRMVEALLAWGAARNAERAYLQVTASNERALNLYEATGFREAYRYHYRIRSTAI
ncbi:GNAT family N-acetyltransferase [Skermanella mucosa]|uniref:GNAT family N-acetyltransferase n=1 Tax=Skermanella mucosa TaxID=1789672 RepID=UPI00192AB5A4|nr:GNAT family N-acetyltransferase [Skermanella mucosa]UEM23853.1 GNAT family N-acetyltransferase [Skermanella mucosa]